MNRKIPVLRGPRFGEDVDRLDGIIQEFNSFAREQRLDFSDVALPELLRSLRDLWFPLASDRAIDLILDLAEQEMVLHADAQKLSRVIDNLVKNAIEAVGHGPGSVTIAAAPIARHAKIRISVADTGPGIDPTIDAFALFETTKPNGTGLGLPIARQIVVAHGGDMQFESRNPHGTVFHVDLPVSTPAL